MPVQTALKEELLQATPKGRIRFHEPMRLHTTFHIGGPAEMWAEPWDEEELRSLLKVAQEAHLAITVVGGGANLLVRDEGIPGLVLHLAAPGFQRCERFDEGLMAGAGFPIEWLIRRAQEEGFAGVEFLAGVPGRVGGAVRMNAGTHDEEGQVHSLSDVVRWVKVMDVSGTTARIPQEAVGFQYRSTQLNGRIVLETALDLKPDDPQAIAGRVKRLWEFKRRTQDWSNPSVGCIFKNPSQESLGPGVRPSAGWMIDQAGLKGTRVGHASISTLHANFMVNLGNAKASDVLSLIEEAQSRVSKIFGIELELEVKVIP